VTRLEEDVVVEEEEDGGKNVFVAVVGAVADSAPVLLTRTVLLDCLGDEILSSVEDEEDESRVVGSVTTCNLLLLSVLFRLREIA
jgi:hypothetical protein